MDRVDLFHYNREINGLIEETVNEVNIPSINNATMVTRNKRLSTWKRLARRNISNTLVGGVSSSACIRKRVNEDNEEDSMKKPREMVMVDIIELKSNKANVGDN